MSKISYININGKYFDSSTEVFKTENRAFRYGDGLFESMFASGGTVPLIKDHFNRVKKSAKMLKMKWPQLLTSEILEKEITRLINKNRIFGGARIRLSIFREDGGLYSPESNRANYLIESQSVSNTRFLLNEKGIKLGLYERIKKAQNPLSNIKSASALLFVMASLYNEESGFDDCLIMNDPGNIVEAISSNIFLCREKNIYTPTLESGCVEGVMRKNIIRLAEKSGYNIYDDAEIKPDNLAKADEIFLTNAVSGIRWVLAFRNKRYYNKISSGLTVKLNEKLFSDS